MHCEFINVNINMWPPFLKPRSSAYKNRSSTANSIILEISQYIPSHHKSTKHFSASFSFDAKWLACWHSLWSVIELMSFRSRLKAYLFEKAYPPWKSAHPGCFPWCRLSYFPDSRFWRKLISLSAFKSALQRLSAIKVTLELELYISVV